ncbi:metallo-beta-lactamase superfamily protein [Histomonas meleagridis]|uniref:metallo-beta-lactamase superfamily protein n=1 Tax=Histomonas meleagridis TaxID=135588 RepID=UPI00355AC1AD|nr:metallo-beta-lactamase superfamily protein [Histomonas meleagridis]KAH0798328.1 metallo-beta-lactamase superfamily protein [Histomonas meleagridis]
MQTDIVNTYTGDLSSYVSKKLIRENVNPNTPRYDFRNANKMHCQQVALSLVEQISKGEADPNFRMIDTDGESISVIDWACKQRNSELVYTLLQKGSKISYETFQIAQRNNDLSTLSVLSPYVESVCNDLYHSHVYQAYDLGLIYYKTEKIYSFAFNTGQANFIVLRRGTKGVIIDCGESFHSHLTSTFKEVNNHYLNGAAECDKLITVYNEFKKCPGKVMKPFSTKWRAEPPDTFKRVYHLCRTCFKSKEVGDFFLEIKDKELKDEEFIIDHIIQTKNKFISAERQRQKHVLNCLFTNDFEVEAVFITHSHTDHFSLLSELLKFFPNNFMKTMYYFGGCEENWSGDVSTLLRKKMKCNDRIEFVGREYQSRELILLGDIRFKLWGRSRPEKLQNENQNQNTLVITMFYKDVKVLFTGDAEGNVLSRLNIDIPILDNNLAHKDDFENLLCFIANNVKTIRNRKLKENVLNLAEEYLKKFAISKSINSKDLKIYRNYINEMLSLEHSLLVFEPHHGSMTEDSHEIYMYLAAQQKMQVFVICSFPSAPEFLPKEESILGRENIYMEKTINHPITYAIRDIPTLGMTTDPVYTTGAAGDDVVLMSISGKQIEILNLFDQYPKWETFPKSKR